MATLLSINNYFYRRGGADVVFLEQNQLLERLGWEVVPFSMHHKKNFESPWSDYFVSEIEFGEQYSLFQKIAKVPKVIYSQESRRKISSLVDKITPDVAHAHNVYHHISPSILSVLKDRNIPTVLTLHDLKLACPAYKMLAHDGICERCMGGQLRNIIRHRCIKGSTSLSVVIYLESRINRILGSYSKNVSKFVVPSLFYLNKMVEWGWDRDRFEYIPNFVEVDVHTPEYEPGKYFVYFGRLSEEKGLTTLVKAAALANVPLYLAGVGPEESRLKDIARNVGADVKFTGFLTGDSLHDVVRNSRAVVLPSEWYENAPISVMEAYALGKAVIGANIGGIPELVKEGETGFTYESGSVEGLTSVLSKVKSYPDRGLSEMGRRGRHWVEADFTAQRYIENLQQLYKSLID